MRFVAAILFGRFLLVLGLTLVHRHGRGETPSFFEERIVPVLYHHCFSCHSEKLPEPKGGLRLDSAEGLWSSNVIAAGKPEASELYRRLLLPHGDEERMPPLKGGAQPLSDEEKEMLRRWIADGASTGGWTAFNHRGLANEAKLDRLSKSDVPRLVTQLDAWIDRYHATGQTQRHAAIDDQAFLRRIYLDLAGRLPSLEENQRFRQDRSSDKRKKLIEALLESEAYVSHTFHWKADQLRIITRGMPGQPGWLYDDWVKAAIRSQMPYDEFVRRLITASGYLWENGAVGFYVRDLGMPLEHMANLTRIFLGTRIECAQCHDHPLEPITQKDFYQMCAYTYGVSNLYSAAGYSNDNVRQWPELKTRLAELGPDPSLSQGVSRTISYLKRLTTDTSHRLTFPQDYPYDPSLRGKVVEPRTLFGDEAPTDWDNRRQAFAEWLVSPRNPRFALNQANRLWKRVMGAGLIEPVDSLSSLPVSSNAELLDFLTRTLVQLGFDERTFLAVVLNSKVYQSESVRDVDQLHLPFENRGPRLRRLSAEQIWDSILGLVVEDLDYRRNMLRYDRTELSPERLRRLTAMSADEILERARVEMAFRLKHREYQLRVAEQEKLVDDLKAQGKVAEAHERQRQFTQERERFFGAERDAIQMGSTYDAAEIDPRWKGTPNRFLRASEIPLPIPLGHFLRQFGQSDRREIDAYNREPNPTHSLALMNGELTAAVLAPESYLRRQLRQYPAGEQRYRQIFQAILVRQPTADELRAIQERGLSSQELDEELIWSLVNSPEFLFQQ
jgi:hypothetical protein